jgi:hypothetical protein
MSKNLNEGIVGKFIDSFFDSYKKGVEDHFIEKSRERSPELAKSLDNVRKMLDNVAKTAAKLDKNK